MYYIYIINCKKYIYYKLQSLIKIITYLFKYMYTILTWFIHFKNEHV